VNDVISLSWENRFTAQTDDLQSNNISQFNIIEVTKSNNEVVTDGESSLDICLEDSWKESGISKRQRNCPKQKTIILFLGTKKNIEQKH